MQALALAVLAQVGDAFVGRFARIAQPHRLAGHLHFADSVAQAEQAFEQLGATRTHEAGEAEDFAGPHFEADVLGPARHCEATHAQDRRGLRRGLLGGEEVGQLAPHHQVGHVMPRQGLRGLAGDEAPVAHHDHFIRDALDFVQLVRDVDEGDALGLELRHQREQALCLARCQCGRGLVHDQQARAVGPAPWRSPPAAFPRRSGRARGCRDWHPARPGATRRP